MRTQNRKIYMKAAKNTILSRYISITAAIVIICLVLRVLAGGVAASFSEMLLKKIASNESLVENILSVELGIPEEGDSPALVKAVIMSNPLLRANSEIVSKITPSRENAEVVPVFYEPPQSSSAEDMAELLEAEVVHTPEPIPESAEAESDFSADSILITNSTSYNPDIQSMLEASPDIVFDPTGPQILIVHTHSSESYTKSEGDEYDESDTYRTEDKSQNVIRVGDELTLALEAQGFKVIHDRNIYDYPSYAGSYGRTLDAVSLYLQKYPCIGVVIDLHRDSLTNPDGSAHATDACIDGIDSAQVMLLVGTGELGLEHPDWEENLSLAAHLQRSMLEKYASICRPIALTKERYNQHLSPGYFILEVGSTGNTLSEALAAANIFAETAGEVFREFFI